MSIINIIRLPIYLIAGTPSIVIHSLMDYITRDKKWCKQKGIGFFRILKNNYGLLIDLCYLGD